MRRSYPRTRPRGLLVQAIAALLWAIAAATPAAAVRVTAGIGSGMAGQFVDVTISTTDISGRGVVAYQFALNYTGTLVSATDVLEAGTLSAPWGDATLNVTSGRIAVSHAGTAPLSGSGSLVVLRFLVNPGATSTASSPLTFSDFVFNEGVPIDTTANGTITIPASPRITVSPNSGELVRGQTLQFTVSGAVTNPVSWGTTNPAVGGMSGSGLLTGLAPGAVRVFAVDAAGLRDSTDNTVLVRGAGVTVGTTTVVQGQIATVAVSVTDLSGLAVRSGQIQVGFNPNLVVPTELITTGTLLDGYGSASFGTTGSVLSVVFAGTTDLTGPGTLCYLRFRAGTTQTGTSPLTLSQALFNETLPAKGTNGSVIVTPLPSIIVSPETVTLLAGQTQQCTVSGTVTPPVTWSTLHPAVATIDANGLLTAVSGGVTRVRAVDALGASDENTSVTVYDFRLSIPTFDATPGEIVPLPLQVDRDISQLGVHSIQYTLAYNQWIVDAEATSQGLVSVWGSPATREAANQIVIAAAGAEPLDAGSSDLQVVRLQISPSAPLGTDIPISVLGFLCNEGAPSVQVGSGLLRVRSESGIEQTPGAGAWFLAVARPNPLRQSARIAFLIPDNLPDGAPARVTIYDTQGRAIRVLMDGLLVRGWHEVLWDGSTDEGEPVAAGVYVYRLSWPGRSMERKLVVIR